MNIHLIATGGSAMHNLAIALYYNHHTVTGSDDEIYDPARSRLAEKGLLPEEMGWFPEKITEKLDAVILGMHARPDNPELKKAQELGISIYSYPEYLFNHAKDKKRLVIAGSHGKTTTTAMIMHALKFHNYDYDFLVGAQLEGFDNMVRLSDAPLIVIEGDEYLSSPIDRRPKFLHYKPHIAIITGVAWDHINVFPTFENYVEQFDLFIKSLAPSADLYYYKKDEHLAHLLAEKPAELNALAYETFPAQVVDGKTILQLEEGEFPLQIFGQHNLENLQAACLACKSVGMTRLDFLKAMATFKGAAKRMQTLATNTQSIAFQDFAHAPSKVKATIKAVKSQFGKQKLCACLELHTFSSLNKDFLPLYKEAMNAADEAYVFFADHTLQMKKLPPISKEEVQVAFAHPNLQVIKDNQLLLEELQSKNWEHRNLLMMSSGNFGGFDLKAIATDLLSKNA